MTEETIQQADAIEEESKLDFDLFTTQDFSLDRIFYYRSRVYEENGESQRLNRHMESVIKDTQAMEPLRKGVILWIVGRYAQAYESLKQISNNTTAAYLTGRCLLHMEQFQQAQEIFSKLSSQDRNQNDFQTAFLESLEMAEKWDELAKAINNCAASYKNTTDYLYFEARLLEAQGDIEKSLDKYEEVLEKDENHKATLFRLAYNLDLRGADEEAIALYEKLTQISPIDARPLINLGILYEDRSNYKKAIHCFHAVVQAYPNHLRAKKYLGDARASLNMFYDEDLERKEDKLQQILRIPITDFELSVRARNCLAKMEINTLGDLVRKTEIELLSFKNFGETSLEEIKIILNSKGLRLGMTREDNTSTEPMLPTANPVVEGAPQEILQKSVSTLELSVRSRRIMDNLGAKTLGELIQFSEKELLAKPNFGQTSLNEIKEKLRECNLKLKDSK